MAWYDLHPRYLPSRHRMALMWGSLVASTFLLAVLVQFWHGTDELGIGVLYVLPVLIGALAFGPRTGFALAIVASTMTATWAVLSDVDEAGAAAALARAVVYLLTAAVVGALSQESRRETAIVRAVLDALPDPASVKSVDGRYLFANRALEDAIAVQRGSIVGRPTGYAAKPDTTERVVEADRQVLETGRAVELEVDGPAPDGSTRTYRTVKAPVLDVHDRVTAIVTIGQDITSRVAYERELASLVERARAEYDRAHREYSQLVRHRIANPLAIIHGVAYTLDSPYADDPQRRRELVQMLQDALERIEQLDTTPAARSSEERTLDPRPASLVDDIRNHIRRFSADVRTAGDERRK